MINISLKFKIDVPAKSSGNEKIKSLVINEHLKALQRIVCLKTFNSAGLRVVFILFCYAGLTGKRIAHFFRLYFYTKKPVKIRGYFMLISLSFGKKNFVNHTHQHKKNKLLTMT